MNSGSRTSRVVLGLTLAAAMAFSQQQQQPTKRGIRIATEGAKSAMGSSKLPRGFAILIAGSPKFDRDARLLYNTLISTDAGNFAEQDVRLLTGANATADKVRQAIEQWLPSVAGPEDRVVVYFAGDAFVVLGKAFLALPNTVPAQFEQTAYPVDTLGTTLSAKVKSQWKAVFLDAAHGGTLTAETSNSSVNRLLGSFPGGVLAINASRRQESSLADPSLAGGHGLFTYYLSQGMRGEADGNGDGYVVADELIEYLRSRIRDHAQRLGSKQTPSEGGEFDPGFIFAYDPSVESKKSGGTLVITLDADNAEVLIDGKSAGSTKGSKLAVANLAAGKHVVQAIRNGARSEEKQVVVVPGKEVPVRLTF